MATCSDCQFFSGKFCRVEPPTANELGRGLWPQVSPEDWCGAYQAIEFEPPEQLEQLPPPNPPNWLAKGAFSPPPEAADVNADQGEGE